MDLIDRQEVLAETGEWLNDLLEDDSAAGIRVGIRMVRVYMKQMSAVKPEWQWIPCSERLPEKSEDVLLQFQSCMGVGFYENGWAVNTGDGIFSEVGEREEKPIAWTPLPEPYRGEKQNGSD